MSAGIFHKVALFHKKYLPVVTRTYISLHVRLLLSVASIVCTRLPMRPTNIYIFKCHQLHQVTHIYTETILLQHFAVATLADWTTGIAAKVGSHAHNLSRYELWDIYLFITRLCWRTTSFFYVSRLLLFLSLLKKFVFFLAFRLLSHQNPSATLRLAALMVLPCSTWLAVRCSLSLDFSCFHSFIIISLTFLVDDCCLAIPFHTLTRPHYHIAFQTDWACLWLIGAGVYSICVLAFGYLQRFSCNLFTHSSLVMLLILCLQYLLLAFLLFLLLLPIMFLAFLSLSLYFAATQTCWPR